MEKGDTAAGAQQRKRKIKFSERELEHLIEGVAHSHDQLFGKLSLKVPEAEKRRIWLRIKAQVNAVGVTNRSIDELKKRWYDMRSRAKERIAARLKEALSTGGGPSTVDANTALDDMVEGTIQPEAVVGVTELDTSGAAGTSQDAAEHDSDGSHTLVIAEDLADSEAERQTTPAPSQHATAPPPRRAQVTPLVLMEAETTPAPVPALTTTHPVIPTPRARVPVVRPRHRVTPRAEPVHQQQIVCGGIEHQMLRVNRLQARHMGGMQLQLNKVARNVAEMTASVRELTSAVREGNRLMVEHQDITRRRHRQLLTRLSAYTRSNHIVGNATALLSRRSLSMQMEMINCSANVARALAQVTTAVDNFQAAVVGTTRGGDDASEGSSSVSTASVPVVTDRRRSGRSATRSTPPQADVQDAADRRTGMRGRRRE